MLSTAPALAQDSVADEAAGDPIILYHPYRDTYITVLATGHAEPIVRSGQSISVVGADEIEAVQGPDLTRVLERLPGVTTARSGGLGSQTSLFVRGANSQQLLVTIDGVRMADVAAPSGGFDLGTLLTGGIAKLELLRGSNSVAWGSDAMGGVLAVTSKTPGGLAGSLEYGANDTLTAGAEAGLAGDGYSLGVSGGYTRTDGISAYAAGTEPDGFRQWHGTVNGEAELASNLSLRAVARYADSTVDFDGYPAPNYTFADTPEYQNTRQGSGRVGLDYNGDGLNLAAGLALSDTRRAYFDPTYGTAPNFETQGRSWRADMKGRADLTDAFVLDFGADSEWTRFSTTYDAQQDARLSSGHALLGYHGGSVHLTGGVRLDDHDRFGSHWTFGANGAVELAGDLRLRASFGEGFKAPTLYQLYGYGGNVALRPETSTAFDAGVELGDRGGYRHFAVTLFRRDSRNLIDYVWPTGYFNTARARAEGVEAELTGELTEGLRGYASYSYTKSVNRQTGKDLARRPRHAFSTGLEWTTPLHDLAVGADLRVLSSSFDDAGNFTRLGGFALVTLRASLPVTETVELYGRVENLGNKQYQTVAGYGTYGRSAFAGIRARW
ncbi:TonB-dependent siderophore receptor [Novosphingobium sp.]|uniref:TonB-dependent receptor plug domain-containing protein n=1 Tax=Novosphingobium sp. TaxID=1874826 RepID=UPI002735A1CF|nr:TonB-dependent receptor [Novosphingobium sp.]MDP3907442.1 TonB-dependent receptor [Novosphingobium sp.]